nr:hypothetical protein CFP56_13391 [Quercus suber]
MTRHRQYGSTFDGNRTSRDSLCSSNTGTTVDVRRSADTAMSRDGVSAESARGRSDYALLQRMQRPPRFQDQYILGHEGCGEIIEMGEDVGSTEFKLVNTSVVGIDDMLKTLTVGARVTEWLSTLLRVVPKQIVGLVART